MFRIIDFPLDGLDRVSLVEVAKLERTTLSSRPRKASSNGDAGKLHDHWRNQPMFKGCSD
ncbi:hypothetical protein M7I_1078 [Glarea lozoyensis 74030]|uniref:Uncharacterized protein n=1 Tax=Glarea lozoyensis (strain ATCC 74030 / MF5533) TaxID=1104152 RepID=H0EF40_GLAL7|nr:hypothetical protein M7I_1078 [Glarea lozoyensis 74030]